MDIYSDTKRDIKSYVRTQGKTKLSATFARFIEIDQKIVNIQPCIDYQLIETPLLDYRRSNFWLPTRSCLRMKLIIRCFPV